MTDRETTSTSRYQTPANIREVSFQRRMRGLDADKVYDYLDMLADQLEATEGRLKAAHADNERLRAEVQRLQQEVDEFEDVGDRVNEQVVQMFSQAQLVAEEMVNDVSRDARERIGQARAHEREIVQDAVNSAGEQIRSYAQAAQEQMKSIMDSFAHEVDRLGSPPSLSSGEPTQRRSMATDPLFDDYREWQARFGNGHGSGSNGTR